VGQAVDLVRDGENGFLLDVDDEAAIADRLALVAADPALAERLVDEGRRTAEANAYERQLPLWEALFDGFVARG
jgi:glycosyltransferase involved in cell wall biosynthesis